MLGVTDGKWTGAIITELNSGNTNFDLDRFDMPSASNYQGSAYVYWRVPPSDEAELGFHGCAGTVAGDDLRCKTTVGIAWEAV